MPNGNKPTVNQHIVPVAYLKGFSDDKKNVYFYDIENKISPGKAVPIKSILYKKNAYELRNAEKDIIYTNYIENCLSQLEKLLPEYISSIERKAFYRENHNISSFLTSEEKTFWITYITIQILRTTTVLSVAKEFCDINLAKNIGKHNAENLALSYCLPFFEEIHEDDMNAFSVFVKPFCSMSFDVGVVEGDKSIFTSDNPVYVEAPIWPCEEYRKVIFPITSKICLFMYGQEEKKYHKRNGLFPIVPEVLEEILWSVSLRADRMIVSGTNFTEQEMEIIRKARKDRIENDYSIIIK